MMTSGTLADAATKRSPWMFNPYVDILFGCGGLFWIIFAIHVLGGYGTYHISQPLPFEGILLLVASSLFSHSHVAATMLRLYGKRETRNRLWFYSYVLLALVFPLLAACLLSPEFLAMLLLIHTAVVIDHTIAQNYGVTLMYCYRAGYEFSRGQKSCMQVMHHALAWYSILRLLTYKAWIPTQVFGMPVPEISPLPEVFAFGAGIVLLGSIIALGAMTVQNDRKGEKAMPLPAMLLLLTSVIMFSSAVDITMAFYFFIPTFFHATQYMLINTYYHLKETSSDQSISNRLLSRTTLKYWSKCLVLGFVVQILLPLALTIFGFPFAVTSIAALICFAFHHFLADRVLWKLRDPDVRANLV